MRRPMLYIAAAAAALAAAPAMAQNLSLTSGSTAAHIAELNAEQAAVDNDWSAVAADAARAYQAAPSAENEFNLAVAYENTGRATLAIPLYRDVAARGQMAIGRALYDYHRTRGPDHKAFYLRDQAANRLYALTGVPVAPGE